MGEEPGRNMVWRLLLWEQEPTWEADDSVLSPSRSHYTAHSPAFAVARVCVFCSPVILPVVVTLSVVHKPGATASPGARWACRLSSQDTLEQINLLTKSPRIWLHIEVWETLLLGNRVYPQQSCLWTSFYSWCSAVGRCSLNICFNFCFWNDLYLEKVAEVAKIIGYSRALSSFPNGHSLSSYGTMA